MAHIKLNCDENPNRDKYMKGQTPDILCATVLTLILCTTVLPYPLLINESLPNFPLGRKAEREDGDQSQKLARRDGNS